MFRICSLAPRIFMGVAWLLLLSGFAPFKVCAQSPGDVSVERGDDAAEQPKTVWRLMDRERARDVVAEWKKTQKKGGKPSKPSSKQGKDFLDAVEAFQLIGDTSTAMAMLDSFLSEIPSGAVVSKDGARDPINLQLRDAALAWALRYRIDRQAADAEHARDLLLQFAAKIPEWPIRANRQGNLWRSQDTASIYSDYGAGGLWGNWYHLDLRDGLPLLRAFDLIIPTISEEDRRLIVSGIFDHQVKLLLRWEPLFHNTDIYEIDGLIRFGLILRQPESIHHAVDRMRKLYYRGFSPDGFWHEVTPAYHRQVAGPLPGLMSLLRGYSDPVGWHHPQSELRYDGLQLDEEFAAHTARIKRSQEKITLPNGYLLALNDSDPDRYRGEMKPESRPELLGTSGVALLGSGEGALQEQVVVNFEGTHGHEHLDGNSLYWYALGVPVFDETRYRPIAGSTSTRAWSESTYAHNTVVIDEGNQPGRFARPHRDFGEDDQMQGSISWPLRSTSGGSNHAGDLLLFDGSETAVQAVEVEGKKAYQPGVEVYRRSVLKVNLGGGASYLVDIFRVKGGKIHEYMLHGALSLPYTAEYSINLDHGVGTSKPEAVVNAVKESARSYLRLSGSQTMTQPWHVTYSVEGGPRTRSWVLAPKGSLVCSFGAPAINRVGDAVFTGVRNESSESVFVAIHEVYSKAPRIKGARLLSEPSDAIGGLAIEIDLGTRKDVVLSTFGACREIQTATDSGLKVALRGRLAWMQADHNALERAIMWDGEALDYNEKELLRSPRSAIEGVVIKTLRRERGDDYDALVVDGKLPLGDLSKDSVVHVDFGGELTWSYRLGRVERDQEGNWAIRIEHEPGFEIQPGGLAKMLFHPGWGNRNGVRFRIPMVTKTAEMVP